MPLWLMLLHVQITVFNNLKRCWGSCLVCTNAVVIGVRAILTGTVMITVQMTVLNNEKDVLPDMAGLTYAIVNATIVCSDG